MNTPLPPPAPGAAPSIVPVLAHLVMVLGIALALFAIPQVRHKLGHWFSLRPDPTQVPATFQEDPVPEEPAGPGERRDLHSFDHSLYDRLNTDRSDPSP